MNRPALETQPVASAPALPELTPWQFLNEEGRVVACSWCQAEQQITPTKADGSHGICPRHARAQLQAIESAPALNREQIAILDHTEHRSARGLYCGGGKEMDALVALGMMASAGRAAWCPDEYFRITGKGRSALRRAVMAVEPKPQEEIKA